MSLNPTPGVGKSCTSRIFVLRSTRAHSATSRRSRQKSSAVSSCASSPSDWRSRSAGGAPLGVPRAERRRDDLLEQRDLAVGRAS